jgi:tRNA (cytidine/uridine-2'-O-)-methyltransferase
MLDLPPHKIELALIHPQIAPNTGNIARLCVATATKLHLVRPMGFVLDDRQVRRSAMDYWPRLQLTVHDEITAFRAAMINRRMWLFDSLGTTSLFAAPFADGDVLVFGSETSGVPSAWLDEDPSRTLRIPQSSGERCLNLSTAAGIALYACLRGIGAAS